MIEPVYEAITSLGLVPQKDVAVGVADYYQPATSKPKIPDISSTLSLEEFGDRLARLLSARARGETSAAKGIYVPVRLESPGEQKG
jgi:hypothetical protein